MSQDIPGGSIGEHVFVTDVDRLGHQAEIIARLYAYAPNEYEAGCQQRQKAGD